MKKRAIIVGCGISGASLANILANRGWHIDIYEKEKFVGGNCFDCENKDGILVHKFGPHIFHTSNHEVYKFLLKYCKLNGYINKVLVNVKGKTFPLPINFRSIEIIMGKKAKHVIHVLKKSFPNSKSVTLFDLKQLNNKKLDSFLKWISKNVYMNYSTKMWGVKFNRINPNTINRVRIILGYEHNYFPNDIYQGLPKGGYTKLIRKMISHPNIKLHLNVNVLRFLKFNKSIYWNKEKLLCPLIYCGSLDELINYKYGWLPYRSLNIKFETLYKKSFQKTAVINYPARPKMTRICEYKKMTFQKNKKTTISKEYPGQFHIKSKKFNNRYYPISSKNNAVLYNKYLLFFRKYKNFYPLGRLGQYKYIDMDEAIENAFKLAREINND